MRTWHATTIVVLLGGLTAGGWLYAQGGQTAMTLTGGDIAEIKQLYARYNQGLDFEDPELYLSAFTDDAVFTTRDRIVYAGRDELNEYLTRVFHGVRGGIPPSANFTHNNTSIRITPTADGAQGRAYWMVIDVLSHPPAIAAHAYWDDTFVKTADGWRIKTRTSQRGWPRLAKTQ